MEPGVVQALERLAGGGFAVDNDRAESVFDCGLESFLVTLVGVDDVGQRPEHTLQTGQPLDPGSCPRLV